MRTFATGNIVESAMELIDAACDANVKLSNVTGQLLEEAYLELWGAWCRCTNNGTINIAEAKRIHTAARVLLGVTTDGSEEARDAQKEISDLSYQTAHLELQLQMLAIMPLTPEQLARVNVALGVTHNEQHDSPDNEDIELPRMGP